MGYVLAVVGNPDEKALRRSASIPDDTPLILLSSIREAKAVVSHFVPDAVLIERQLPDGFGIEFVNYLNGYPTKLAGVPIVVLKG